MKWKCMSTQRPVHEMFTLALFKIATKLENPNVPELGNAYTKHRMSIWWNTTQLPKGTDNQSQQGLTSVHSAKGKKQDREDCMPCDAIYMEFQKRQNFSIQKQISGCMAHVVREWGTDCRRANRKQRVMGVRRGDYGESCMTVYMYTSTKTQLTAHVKQVNFTAWKTGLNRAVLDKDI